MAAGEQRSSAETGATGFVAFDGGGPARPDPRSRARAYIPCPSCGSPIELPSDVRRLPDRITCPTCGARLKRGTS